MAVDLSDSVEKWKNHFQAMARGKIPKDDIYIINQRGKGLGTNPKGRALYRVQTGGQSVPSPADQGFTMAMQRIKNTKRKRSKSATASRSRSRSTKRRKTTVKRKRRVTKRHTRKVHPSRKKKKATTKRRTAKRRTAKKGRKRNKRGTKRKVTRRKVKDIFQ